MKTHVECKNHYDAHLDFTKNFYNFVELNEIIFKLINSRYPMSSKIWINSQNICKLIQTIKCNLDSNIQYDKDKWNPPTNYPWFTTVYYPQKLKNYEYLDIIIKENSFQWWKYNRRKNMKEIFFYEYEIFNIICENITMLKNDFIKLKEKSKNFNYKLDKVEKNLNKSMKKINFIKNNVNVNYNELGVIFVKCIDKDSLSIIISFL